MKVLKVPGDSSRGFFGGLFLLGVFWCEFNCNDLLTLDAKNDMHSSAPGKQQKLEECRPWKTHPVSNVFFKLKTKWWWQQIINFPSLQCAMFQSTCDAKNCSSYPGHPTLLAAPGEHLQGRGPKSEEASVGPDLNRISAKDIELHRNTFHLTIQSTPKSAKLGMFAIILVSHHLPNHL